MSVQRLVQRDDAAKRDGAVAIERTGIGLGQGRATRHTAGVGVLDDRDGGAIGGIKFTDQFKRRIGVVDVVVAQLFALMLLAVATPGARVPSV